MTKPTGMPRGRPRKHGAYSAECLLPVTVEKRSLIMAIVKGETTAIARTDEFAVELLARNLAKVELIDRWLQEHGLFADNAEGTPQPILKVYWQAVNTAARLCDALGLTPTARARLGLSMAQTEDLAMKILKVRGT